MGTPATADGAGSAVAGPTGPGSPPSAAPVLGPAGGPRAGGSRAGGPERTAPGTTRLRAGAVVPVDGRGTVWRPGIVDLAGDRLGFVGPSGVAPLHDGPEVLCPGLLMPGMVNAHGHGPMTLLRGVGEGLPLDAWLRRAVWPREAHLTRDDVYWGQTLACAEMLRCGVTTTCETYFHDEAVVDAVVDAGMRAVVTPGILDVPGAGPGRGWRGMLDAACELHAAADGRAGLVTVGLGPHAAYTLPVDALRAVGERARSLGCLVTIHLAETATEGRRLQEAYGTTVPALLADVGLFDGPVVAAHGVWLTDADIELLAQCQVAVAHCPQSNAKLGSGVARLRDLLDAGVTVGLGTDGPASNNDLDLWEEMRLAPLLARALSGDPTAVDASTALALATSGGARALGLMVGTLAPGQLADVVHVRTDDLRFVPVVDAADLLAHLVWSSASHLVDDVWVGGRRVVTAGRCATVDDAAARCQVQRRAERLAAAAGA